MNIKKFIPIFVKQAVKDLLSITRLEQSVSQKISEIQALEQSVSQKISEIQTLEQSVSQKISEIQALDQPPILEKIQKLYDLYEYSVLRPVDLVKYADNLYFWYINDISYQWIGPNSDIITKNYKLTPQDLEPPLPFEFSVQEFFESKYCDFPKDEQLLKFIIFAYLWLNDIDFTFLDIGSNLGNTAIPCATFIKRFKKNNQIFTFEPGVVGNLCKINLVLNNVSDIVHFEPRAVGDFSAALVMNSLLNHSESNSVVDFRKYYPELELALCSVVPTVSIDDFVKEKQISNNLVVKIDAEGNDWQVIQGMPKTIKNQTVILFLEFTPRYIEEFIKPVEVLHYLSKDFYLLSLLSLDASAQWKGSVISTSLSELEEFSEKVASSPKGWTDILAISKRLPQVEALISRLCYAV